MSRPAVVYVVMLLVLVAGLWVVLEIGSYLHAPEDLAGKWQLQSTVVSAGSDPGWPGMNIEQSGRFFQINFERGPQLDLKLQSSSPVVLANSEWKLTVTGRDGGDDKTMLLEGPTGQSMSGRWTAHRTLRTFPADVTPHATTREAR